MPVTTLKPTAKLRDGLAPGQRGRAMAAVLTGVALATLDTAIANTALPTIAADLGVDPGASVWMSTCEGTNSGNTSSGACIAVQPPNTRAMRVRAVSVP